MCHESTDSNIAGRPVKENRLGWRSQTGTQPAYRTMKSYQQDTMHRWNPMSGGTELNLLGGRGRARGVRPFVADGVIRLLGDRRH